MMLSPESALLMRAAAALVPPEQRENWRREWHAELWWWLSSTPDPSRLALLHHCCGAMADAFHLRFSEGIAWADYLDRPSMRLAAPLALLALVAVFSGGFRHTRRALFATAPDNLAILSENGPFMGLVIPLPAAKLAVWTARTRTIESVSVISRTRALVRLRPGVTPFQAEREWRQWSRFVQIAPLAELIWHPIVVLGPPFLFLILIALIDWAWPAPSAFSLAHPVAWLILLFLATVEMPASPTVLLLPYLVASFMALRYCRRDRRLRCPVCLDRLGLPVRIGLGPRSPFEPEGTEFLCPHGHGALFTTSEAEPESHWTPLVA